MDLTIKTERLLLRPLTRDDFDFIANLNGCAETCAYETGGKASEADLRKRCAWFLSSAESLPDEGAIQWIAWRGDTRIGSITAKCNWETTLEWELGYHFLPEFWGQGYGAEGVKAAVQFAFGNFRVHRLAAFINAENVRSKNLAERVGMRLDGRMRDARLIEGRYNDEFVYSLLETDPAILKRGL